jgi:glycosyltransferase involved in cell wall biosynthesis
MNPIESWERQAKVKYVYRFLDCFTVLTHYDYNLLHKSLKNVVRMPNPINFIPASDINQKREKVVLAAGRADAWRHKGFDNLIKCWAKLCKKHPEWTLKIAGKASDETLSLLNKMIAECDASNVELLGFRTDIDDLMSQSEVFCLSSRAEGLPMVLLEAMNAGCCCVSFDVVTGPREIIDDNGNGLLAKNQDIDDLAMKLDMVMSDDELRHRLSANTPSALKEYSLDSVISRWETLFKKVLK